MERDGDNDRGYFQNDRSEILPMLPQKREHVLEIGCGEGRFAAGVPGADEIWAIEPDPVSAEIASGRLNKVFPTTFENARAQLPTEFFDVVICNDVIEHMDDHDVFFTQIRPHLTPTGVLVGSVPNVRYFKNLFDILILKDWHYQHSGVLDRTHKRFFTFKSLERSLKEAGFTVQELHGINSKLSLDLAPGEARYTVFGYAMIGLSLGYLRDVPYMQIAFRASRESNA